MAVTDAATPSVGTISVLSGRATVLGAVNDHRILRRGRKYPAYKVQAAGELPGLLFICLNTDLERQFEFVQQTWLLNGSFAALVDERDPLLGPAGKFTIPAEPLRLCAQMQSAVRFIGGEYFFLPSLPALDYFASLDTLPPPAPASAFPLWPPS